MVHNQKENRQSDHIPLNLVESGYLFLSRCIASLKQETNCEENCDSNIYNFIQFFEYLFRIECSFFSIEYYT